MLAKKQKILAQFCTIPGVGPSIAQDLWDLGLRSLDDLKSSDPEELYAVLCALRGCKIDRCVLYVFRCAVYFVTETEHDTELLKWWNWTDAKLLKGSLTHDF